MSDQSIQRQRPNVYFHRYYDAIFLVAKKEYLRVFLWLYQGGTSYVGDYLQTTPRRMKGLKAWEKAVLNRKELSVRFDICMLYSMLQRTCGLTEDTAELWNEPQTSAERESLEHSLYLIKEIRNDLSHPDLQPFLFHMSNEEFGEKLNELRHLCQYILRKAGEKAYRTTQEIENVIFNMELAFTGVKSNPIPSGFTPEKLAIVAKQEMRTKCSYSTELLTTYVKPLLLPIFPMKSNSKWLDIPLEIIANWHCENGNSPTNIVFYGDSGTGKSALCQYIYSCWLSGSSEILDLQSYDIVVPVTCNNVSNRDILDYLDMSLSESISECGREEFREFLKSLKVLWLLDGFEEATVDARELLSKIRMHCTSHLMIFTVKPQYKQDLFYVLSVDDRVLEVALYGLSDNGIFDFITKFLNQKEADVNLIAKQSKEFREDVQALGKDIIMELHVPLKLKLMLELWQGGRLKGNSSSPFTFLYLELIDLQKSKLLKLIKQKTTLREEEIILRADRWITDICKVAFDMILRSEFLNIKETSRDTVVKISEPLLIYPEDSLSLFINVQGHAKDNPTYSFLHGSQQYFMAAQYVVTLMEPSTNPSQLLDEVFMNEILRKRDINCDHLYMTLLFVISRVALASDVDTDVACALICLLDMCRELNVFEVVQYAGYSPVFVENISAFAEDEWKVTENEMRAAISLLEFQTPDRIFLDIVTDPKETTELSSFLGIISKKILLVHCNLRFHCLRPATEFSDSYLKSLCSSDALCTVVEFVGNLSEEGCRLLFKTPYIYELTVKVTSDEVFKLILQSMPHLPLLKRLTLYIEMPRLPRVTSCNIEIEEFNVILHHLNCSSAKSAAETLSRVSKKYNKITLFDTRASSASRFFEVLKNGNICVNTLERCLDFTLRGEKLYYFEDYGRTHKICTKVGRTHFLE
ncbi:hypothetical protein SK128_014070 [Halocaridina rubra]|uniref:NACHT domain-containing protein n=1 Tax=Halocaridina rubra TaxID=373956 RepID=A0AAN8XXD3_HALRR